MFSWLLAGVDRVPIGQLLRVIGDLQVRRHRAAFDKGTDPLATRGKPLEAVINACELATPAAHNKPQALLVQTHGEGIDLDDLFDTKVARKSPLNCVSTIVLKGDGNRGRIFHLLQVGEGDGRGRGRAFRRRLRACSSEAGALLGGVGLDSRLLGDVLVTLTLSDLDAVLSVMTCDVICDTYRMSPQEIWNWPTSEAKLQLVALEREGCSMISFFSPLEASLSLTLSEGAALPLDCLVLFAGRFSSLPIVDSTCWWMSE